MYVFCSMWCISHGTSLQSRAPGLQKLEWSIGNLYISWIRHPIKPSEGDDRGFWTLLVWKQTCLIYDIYVDMLQTCVIMLGYDIRQHGCWFQLNTTPWKIPSLGYMENNHDQQTNSRRSKIDHVFVKRTYLFRWLFFLNASASMFWICSFDPLVLNMDTRRRLEHL